MVLVTNRRLRGQGQKFFLLFLGDHLRARVTFTFLIFSMAAQCTRVHLCRAKSTTKAGRYENTKMAKKNQVLKKNLLLAGLFLADHSNLLVQVLPPWTSVTQRLLVLLVNKGHQVFPSLLADNHTTTDCERKEPFLSRAPAPAGRC